SLIDGREIMYDYASKGEQSYPDISVYGKTISSLELDRLVREAVTQVGSEIVSFVATAWRQSDRDAVAASFKPVLNIGGGVYYFYSLLKQCIPYLSRPDDPIHSNVLGSCILASSILFFLDHMLFV